MNEKARVLIFQLSLFTLLGASIAYFFKVTYAEYAFAVGAAAYALSQMVHKYQGQNIRAKRLYKMNKISGVVMIAASTLMIKGKGEWLMCLTIGTFLLLYVSFAMPKGE